MRGLKGKVGVIAGGARGIGAATAERLCAEGAKVIIGDIMGDMAVETAKAIEKSGGIVIGTYLDGTDAQSQKDIVARAVKEFGGLDFFHSNLAGGTVGDDDALGITEEVFDKSVAINTKSHLLASQAAIPAMLKRGGGAMIYTSSGAASAGAPVQPAYAMTKTAIHALARHVAAKWGPSGIRANVICPGLIMTEAVAIYLDEERLAGIQAETPSHRLGQPKDIAAAVAFLASDDGEFVNGQAWHVNGGKQMRE
ncbi:SDR family NAD(P)-dependent oxidoreductase [Fretibacter rubidus]|uniref:SDR family NAD(P)-dependent oxidoreductase n=1 Tax=Fretibacter rubidus TaxID=570162 RepID=UPI003529D7A4